MIDLKDRIRDPIETRKIPRNGLKCPSVDITSLIMGDQVMVVTDLEVNREGTVVMNDPFKCEIVLEVAGSCLTRLYEAVIYSSRKATSIQKSISLNCIQGPEISSTASSSTRRMSLAKPPTKSGPNNLIPEIEKVYNFVFYIFIHIS